MNLTRGQVERIYTDSRTRKVIAKDFGIPPITVQKIQSGTMHREITKGLKRPERYNPNKKKPIKLPFSEIDFLLFCKPWKVVN